MAHYGTGLKDLTRDFINLKKFKIATSGLSAMINPNSASVMQAVLMCTSEHFRKMDPMVRIQAVEALIKNGTAFDLVGLCKQLNVRPLVFLTCVPQNAKKGLRLQIDYEGLTGSHWIFLLSDGNGLVWLPVSENGKYIFSPEEAETYMALTEIGPCSEYAVGSSVIYNGLLYTIIKKIGQKYIIEDTNDSSKQKEVKNTDIGASAAAKSDNEILNRIEESKRRMDQTVVNYDIIDSSVYGFFDYVKDAGKSALQLSVQYS